MQEQEREQLYKAFRTFYAVSQQLERRLHMIEMFLLIIGIMSLAANLDRVAERFGEIPALISGCLLLIIGFVYARASRWNYRE